MENKITTGPYHAICSLYGVMENYKIFKDRVNKSKKEISKNFLYFILENINLCFVQDWCNKSS